MNTEQEIERLQHLYQVTKPLGNRYTSKGAKEMNESLKKDLQDIKFATDVADIHRYFTGQSPTGRGLDIVAPARPRPSRGKLVTRLPY